jgi:ankyrin repeat protein
MAKVLLAGGANVNAQAQNVVTALMMARAADQMEIVEILAKAGADQSLKPSGPEFENLAKKFKTQTRARKTEDAAPERVSGKLHLDPRVREVVLKAMKLNNCKIEKE